MKISKRGWIGGLVIVGLVASLLLIVSVSRAGYETAAYTVVEKSGKIEIRDYEQLVIAETTMSGDQNGSFMRLFRYISGDNEAEQKIAMTTPVFMPGGEEGKTSKMQFVVPAEIAAAGAPAASSDSIRLKTRPAGRYIAIRFNGPSTAANRAEHLEKLKAEVEKRGLKISGGPIYAGYDPPMTPGLLRRNEVLFRLAQ
ncbi:MAG: heme-binding protein [Verrucomicrobiota bacterium]